MTRLLSGCISLTLWILILKSDSSPTGKSLFFGKSSIFLQSILSFLTFLLPLPLPFHSTRRASSKGQLWWKSVALGKVFLNLGRKPKGGHGIRTELSIYSGGIRALSHSYEGSKGGACVTERFCSNRTNTWIMDHLRLSIMSRTTNGWRMWHLFFMLNYSHTAHIWFIHSLPARGKAVADTEKANR